MGWASRLSISRCSSCRSAALLAASRALNADACAL